MTPKLRAVPTNLPEPPYPEDVKANGYRPEFDVRRIKQSRSWLLADNEVRPWLVMLWLEAWESSPVGTFDDDDELIAARIGCKLEWFQGHRSQLMRGWQKHSDGMLYHPYICSLVKEMLRRRKGTRERVQKHREQREVTACNALPGVTYAKDQEQEQEQEKSRGATTPKKSTRGTRLQEETLPTAWLACAQQMRPDLSPRKTFDRFRDYWIAQPGQKGVKVDWLATWRNWLRNEKREDPAKPKPSILDRGF